MPTKVAFLPEVHPQLQSAAIAAGAEMSDPEDAEVLVWMGSDIEVLADGLRRAPKLRWVQLPSAGIERFLPVVDREHVWTCAKGAYGSVVGELGVALMLAAARNVHTFARASKWERKEGKTLHGSDALFLGGGGITVSMIDMLRAFGVRSTVVRKHPEPVEGAERTFGIEKMGSALPEADWVIVALALTPETEGMVDTEFLSGLKETAWIVNLARGKHIVTNHLVDAIESKSIGGAALDVTDPEPLPDGHPLWSLENVIITPHAGGAAADAWIPHLAERLRQNLIRFQEGRELIGVVDPDLGY